MNDALVVNFNVKVQFSLILLLQISQDFTFYEIFRSSTFSIAHFVPQPRVLHQCFIFILELCQFQASLGFCKLCFLLRTSLLVWQNLHHEFRRMSITVKESIFVPKFTTQNPCIRGSHILQNSMSILHTCLWFDRYYCSLDILLFS